MKRYFLFAGLTYYPSGRWNDFQGSFDTVEDALAHPLGYLDQDWIQIVDSTTGMIIRDIKKKY